MVFVERARRLPEIARILITTGSYGMLSQFALIALLVTPPSAITYIGRDNQLHVRIPRIERADASIDGALTSPSGSRRRCSPASRSSRRRTAFPPPIRRRCSVVFADGAVRRHSRVRTARRGARDARRSRQDLRRRQRPAPARHVPRPASGVCVRRESVRRADGRHDRRAGTERRRAGGRRHCPGASRPISARISSSRPRGGSPTTATRSRFGFRSRVSSIQSADAQSWDINVVREVQHSGYEDSLGAGEARRTRRSSGRRERSTA